LGATLKVIALVSLVSLTALLAACLPADVMIRQQEEWDHSICLKRGGDYDRCRASIVEERNACLQQWYALPPEERTRIVLKQKPRTPEQRACLALGV
jgi:hypothetical protein